MGQTSSEDVAGTAITIKSEPILPDEDGEG